jgi:hypothetical protein
MKVYFDIGITMNKVKKKEKNYENKERLATKMRSFVPL